MIRLRPCKDRIHIKLDPMTEKIKRIFVPDEHSERTRMATIIAVGPDANGFEVGNRVVVSWYAGVPIGLPQHDLDAVVDRIVTESEILSFVDEVEGEE